MKLTILLNLVSSLFICAVSYAYGDDPWTEAASVSKEVTAKLEKHDAQQDLIIALPNGDTINLNTSHVGSLIPRLGAVYYQPDKVAVVLNDSFSLNYIKYGKKDGRWNVEFRKQIRSMPSGHRQSLCLIELLDMYKVRLTFFKGYSNDGAWRKAREVREDDAQELYDESPAGGN